MWLFIAIKNETKNKKERLREEQIKQVNFMILTLFVHVYVGPGKERDERMDIDSYLLALARAKQVPLKIIYIN